MSNVTNLPFKELSSSGLLVREFSSETDSSELVWHRDRSDRYVTVQSGKGWMLQLENELPKELRKGNVYFIPKRTYHRVIKGQHKLIVEIEEK